MNIGNAVRVLRKKKKLTQKELAIECNISTTALSSIENNDSFPSQNTINAICNALSIPSSYLLLFSVSKEDVPEQKQDVFFTLAKVLKEELLKEIGKE